MRIASPSDPSAGREFPSTFVGMQDKRLIVDAPQSVAISASVTVECEDTTLFGEVAAVTEMNGRYYVAISVEQVLSHLQSLMALRAHLLGENTPAARQPQSVGALQTA